jgi:C-terminal processing protease CtpA/Prc
MIGALIERPTSSPKWKYPHYVAAHKSWGRAQQWTTGGNTILPRDGKRYAGPVVILTAGTASSTAEDFIISLKYAGRAVLVGEKTAGSAGNPLEFPLPGGGRFEVATFRAYLPDGREYIGIGVQPDLEIHPTREDIVGGTDPALEKGIEIILNPDRYEELTN